MPRGVSVEDLRFESDAPNAAAFRFQLVRLEGEERLGRPYGYELWLETEADGGVPVEDIEAMLAAKARVILQTGHGSAVLHGVLESITFEVPTRPAVYRATLVPSLARLATTVRSRVFCSKSAPYIVAEVLDAAGVAYESQLLRGARSAQEDLPDPGPGDDDYADYPQREYVAQYQESDLDFIHRLLEHEGIYYYFRHDDAGEVLVLVDENRHLPEHPSGVRFGVVEQGSEDELVTTLERRHRIGTKTLTTRDYNWRTPSVSLVGEAVVDEALGFGEVDRYGDHFRTPEEATRLASRRAELLFRDREVYRASSTSLLMHAGLRVGFQGFEAPELDQAYVLTGLQRRCGVSEDGLTDYVAEFEAIVATTPFRPALETPRPRIEGVMHAHVDGEVRGMAAPIDEHGRYKVVLPFDPADQPTGKASRWIRMSQPSSGPGYGIHFPLHVGVEVLLVHQGADPDRPLIVGAVPNPETVTPVTQENSTQSRVATKSGIVLEFEDDA